MNGVGSIPIRKKSLVDLLPANTFVNCDLTFNICVVVNHKS
jgi:hypothetical protein